MSKADIDIITQHGFTHDVVENAISLLGEDCPLEHIIQYLKDTSVITKLSSNNTLTPSSTMIKIIKPVRSGSLKMLSYNIWFEDVAFKLRMDAVSKIIMAENPDVICLQEVTPQSYSIFTACSWWSQYKCCSPPLRSSYFVLILTKLCDPVFQTFTYPTSQMGRCLEAVICPSHNIIFATTHLESPTPPSMNEQERKLQLQFAFQKLTQLSRSYGQNTYHSPTVVNNNHTTLSSVYDIVLAGDLNWAEERGKRSPGDGPIPYPDSHWVDVWEKLYSPPLSSSHTSSSINITNKEKAVATSIQTNAIPMKVSVIRSDPQASVLEPDSHSSNQLSSSFSSEIASKLITDGYTYNAASNPMLLGYLKGRLDRCLCRFHSCNRHSNRQETIGDGAYYVGYNIHNMRFVGCEELPNITFKKRTYTGREHELKVLPSDHYGIVMEWKKSDYDDKRVLGDEKGEKNEEESDVRDREKSGDMYEVEVENERMKEKERVREIRKRNYSNWCNNSTSNTNGNRADDKINSCSNSKSICDKAEML